jgi:hypothetical protein
MLKVFFADAGDLAQLRTTLSAIEDEAADRLRALADMAAQGAGGATAFPQRLHLSAVALRLHFEQEAAVLRWARWAQAQLTTWAAADDPADWDSRAALQELVEGTGRLAPDPTT